MIFKKWSHVWTWTQMELFDFLWVTLSEHLFVVFFKFFKILKYNFKLNFEILWPNVFSGVQFWKKFKKFMAKHCLRLQKSVIGLNIIDFKRWNRVAPCKLLWALSHNKDTLLLQWIRSFYIKFRDLSNLATLKQVCRLVRKILDARTWFLNMDPIQHLKQFSVERTYSIKKTYISFIPQIPKVTGRNLVMSSGDTPKTLVHSVARSEK